MTCAQATKGKADSVLSAIDRCVPGERWLLRVAFSNAPRSYSASEENLYQIGCREKAAVFDSIVRRVSSAL